MIEDSWLHVLEQVLDFLKIFLIFGEGANENFFLKFFEIFEFRSKINSRLIGKNLRIDGNDRG